MELNERGLTECQEWLITDLLDSINSCIAWLKPEHVTWLKPEHVRGAEEIRDLVEQFEYGEGTPPLVIDAEDSEGGK
jgi:hypothetical protein